MSVSPIFLSLDGVDGAGKSTQVARLVDWLTGLGRSVVACRDPGGTRLGDEVRRLLLERRELAFAARAEMLLYMASRAQLVEEVIAPALAAGRDVVSDRYLLANVVYQGYAGGLDSDELWRIGQVATAGRLPDLTLVLDLPTEIALARLDRPLDRMESRGEEFLRRVREGFRTEAARRPGEIVLVDAARSADDVQTEIRRTVTERFGWNP
jgi:dTMP kinase